MRYRLKEIYYTLQGEGARSGQAAVFCRFSGCNLWSGSESDRSSAACSFCDTDFVGLDGSGGGEFEKAMALARAIADTWQRARPSSAKGRSRLTTWHGTESHGTKPREGPPMVVCTGGEPLLQMDDALVAALHAFQFEIAVETNGTLPAPRGIDWLCVSPKAGTEVLLRQGNELKLAYPQAGLQPEEVAHWEFDVFSLQPIDGPHREENVRRAVEYCLRNPNWRLSLQTQKWIGIP